MSTTLRTAWLPAAVALLLVTLGLSNVTAKRSFTVDYENDQFLKDGKPFRYVAGAVHYYNIPTELWRDRLQKVKFGGLNAVQTYIEWSLIEPKPGVYDFSGNNNITHYIQIAQEEGLLVILRPAPFIDSERDMGGLPPWLLKVNPQMKLRAFDPTYIAAVDRYYKALLPVLRPLLYVNGGPVVMVQLENEYGSFKPQCTDNGQYKAYLRETFRKALGPDVLLYTTDGCSDYFLQCGPIPEVFATCDFGAGEIEKAEANVKDAFASLRRHQLHGPLVNSEYYVGWFDVWEQAHQTVPIANATKTLDVILSMNASVTLYMYHGGTHFGFMAGSNDFGTYVPVTTSYDFDAPINEAGDLTPKFFALKEVIKKYLPVSDTKTFVSISSKMELPPTVMELKATIFDVLPEPIPSDWPQSFEALNHSYGFMLYSTNLTFQPTDPANLSIPQLHDRAQVFIDRENAGMLSLTEHSLNVPVLARKNSKVDILVENQGRLSYAQKINQGKGILGNVSINSYPLAKWKQYRLFDNWTSVLRKLPSLSANKHSTSRTPSFYYGQFVLPDKANYPLDSFLQVSGWTKGVAFLNEHNLGRYWPLVGPQQTLYAPSVFFRPYPQTNTIVLFELEQSPCHGEAGKCSIQFVGSAVINGTVPLHKDKPK